MHGFTSMLPSSMGLFDFLSVKPRTLLPSKVQIRDFGKSSWLVVKKTPPIVAAMAVLGVGVTSASGVLIKGFSAYKDTITVTGTSTERIMSDYVDWSVVVSQSSFSRASAYKKLQPSVQAVVSFLEKNGIQDNEIELDSVTVEKDETRDPRSGEIRSTVWTAKQYVLVGSWNVRTVHSASKKISNLIGEGIPLVINDPRYTYTKLAQKRIDMLEKATADARNRAKAIVRQAGSAIGPMTNADTGTFQLTVPNSTSVSGYGSYDTRTIPKDITAIMSVTFRVQ